MTCEPPPGPPTKGGLGWVELGAKKFLEQRTTGPLLFESARVLFLKYLHVGWEREEERRCG